MPLNPLINQILQIREGKAEIFSEKDTRLKQWNSKITSLIEVNGHEFWSGVISSAHQNSIWNEIVSEANNLKQRIIDFTSEDGIFRLACNRAQRKYINIGAVGIMREGKSQFIATATNLGKWVLPRMDTAHPCTTTAINIIKGSSPDGKINIARIYYQTVDGIVKLFAKYFEELGEDPAKVTSHNIRTRNQLRNWCVANQTIDFPNDIASGKTEMQIMFEKYRVKIDDYVDKLIESSADQQYEDYDIEEIERGGAVGKLYFSSVSYYETPNSVDGSEVYTSFSTKEAKIFTDNFNIVGEDDVNNLQFLDTPGIGEQKVGIDTLLAEAITRDLDIVVGVRKFGAGTGAANPLGEKYLFNALRKSMAVWPKSKEWIFFILNAFPGATYNLFEISRDRIISNLKKIGEKNTSIKLEESHFTAIDLLNNRGLTINGYTDDNPIGRFLTFILETLIPRISEIDNDFYNRAEKEYLNIESSYKKLVDKVKSLRLPSYNDLSEAIEKHLQALHNALKGATPSITKITDCLDDDIADFTGNGENPDQMGLEVAKVFGLEDKFNSKEKLFELLSEKAGAEFKFHWYNHSEFSEYEFKRRALIQQMKKSLNDKIKWENATTSLNKAKEEAYTIFMTTGNLDKVVSSNVHNPSEWLDLFISLLEENGNYPHILSAFIGIRDYSINKEEELKKDIDEAIQRGYHYDKFEPWNFEKEDYTVKAFLESLYNIECATKNLLEDDLAKNKILSIATQISNVFNPLINCCALTLTNLGEKSKLRLEFENFFRAHGEIFVNDDDAIRQSLVEKCLNITK